MRALLLLLLIALAAPDAHARQGTIHRCVGADGHPVFTDRSCATMQATPAPVASSQDAPSSPLAPPPVLCPATPAVLRQQVVDAFAAHDPNRMAGLMLWDGYSQRAAIASIQALGAMMQPVLLDVSTDDPGPPALQAATAIPDPAGTPPLPGNGEGDLGAIDVAPSQWLTVETTGEDASGMAASSRFPIVAMAGCLWLRPAEQGAGPRH